MDTHAIYEGAIRLLAAKIAVRKGAEPMYIYQDIDDAIAAAVRTWFGAHEAAKTHAATSREVAA